MSEIDTILTINPGSTSTKLAIFGYAPAQHDLHLIKEQSLEVKTEDIPLFAQVDERYDQLRAFLRAASITPRLIMSRAAPLRPLEGGIYSVTEDMLDDIRSMRYADHASNLGPLLGARLAQEVSIPCCMADPITTDELQDIARISGVPEIERRSRSHALNIKASARRVCQILDLELSQTGWVVAHMGGGISIAALQKGRIIDVNDALLGMGPFSPERAGALPLEGLLDLAYSGEYDKLSLKKKLSKQSGLKGYLGTSDLREILSRIDGGDIQAERIFRAMIYQIAKEIAAMASVLNFQMDGIILTGGMAHAARLTNSLEQTFKHLAPIYTQAGENESLALAEAGVRMLLGLEKPKNYSKIS